MSFILIRATKQSYLPKSRVLLLLVLKIDNIGEEFIEVLSNLFSNPFSMYLYRCVLPCVNTYLEINTV